jgi:hypothetical protein
MGIDEVTVGIALLVTFFFIRGCPGIPNTLK